MAFAKNDTVGAGGEFTFTITDLLANDGGTLKTADSFVFGTDQANQAQYLVDHGITNNGDGSYTLTSDAFDFQYMIQTGNKGTWSTADVDVAATPEKIIQSGAGDLLFSENFDTYGLGTVDMGGGSNPGIYAGWTTSQNIGAMGEIVQDASGNSFLDTQNDISTWFMDPTGNDSLLSFDLGIQAGTAENATFNVLVDGQLRDTIDYSEVLAKAGDDPMGHFEYVIDGGEQHSHDISFVDVTPDGNIGFALDTVQVHDWFI